MNVFMSYFIEKCVFSTLRITPTDERGGLKVCRRKDVGRVFGSCMNMASTEGMHSKPARRCWLRSCWHRFPIHVPFLRITAPRCFFGWRLPAVANYCLPCGMFLRCLFCNAPRPPHRAARSCVGALHTSHAERTVLRRKVRQGRRGAWLEGRDTCTQGWRVRLQRASFE
jgi:hypothetical protein